MSFLIDKCYIIRYIRNVFDNFAQYTMVCAVFSLMAKFIDAAGTMPGVVLFLGLIIGLFSAVLEILLIFSKPKEKYLASDYSAWRENLIIYQKLVSCFAPLLIGIGIVFGTPYILISALFLGLGYAALDIPAKLLRATINFFMVRELKMI